MTTKTELKKESGVRSQGSLLIAILGFVAAFFLIPDACLLTPAAAAVTQVPATGTGGGGASTNLNIGHAIYVDQINGNDTTGGRGNAAKPFLTITAAKAAAAANDTIIVGAGTYFECDLLKKGVNYYFQSGAIVSFVAVTNNSHGIFDDRTAGATTNIIAGYGTFVYTNVGSSTPIGALVVTNALSEVTFKASHLIVDYEVFGSPFAAIDIRNCRRVYIDVNEITDPEYGNGTSFANGIYWQAGEVYAHVDFAQMDGGYVVWADSQANGTTNNMWFDCSYAETFAVASTFYMSTVITPDDSFKLWVRAKEIKNQSGGGASALSALRGGKLYCDAEKLTGVNGSTGVTATDGSIWLNCQKVESDTGTLIQTVGVGRNFFNVLQYSYTGTAVAPAIDIRGGTNEFNGGRLIVTNQTAVQVRGSTRTRLSNMHITGIATTSGGNTNNPIVINTNGVTLSDVTVFAPSGANAIWNTNAASVVVEGLVTTDATIATTNITWGTRTNWMGGDLHVSGGVSASAGGTNNLGPTAVTNMFNLLGNGFVSTNLTVTNLFTALGNQTNAGWVNVAGGQTNWGTHQVIGQSDLASVTNRGGFTNGGRFLNLSAFQLQTNTPALTGTGTTNFIIDCSLGNVFNLFPTANFKLWLTNSYSGFQGWINIVQDGSGSRLWIYDVSNIRTNASLILSTAANSVDRIDMRSDTKGTNVQFVLNKNFQ